MRSYTSKEGEVINVSEEHLLTAVRIKRELQMSSPSHRCNWSKHRKLMEKEGFHDSEASENYRLMIKNYQQSIGQLDSKEKYVDLVADSKLNSIRESVGEMAYTKREVQIESLKLGKLKRELTLYGVVAEQVYNALVNELTISIPKWSYQERKPIGDRRMVVFLSDWHIGSVVVNVNGNSYNYVIAKKRITKFVKRIVDIAKQNNINDIDVVCLGDMTEHVSMRSVNQAFESEFPVTVQMVKAFELIRDLLVNLTEHFNVTYRGVSGNHDRFNGKKDDNIDGDSTIFVINYMVKQFAEVSKIPRLEYFESDNINYSATLSINGINMKLVHGDNEKGNSILASHSALDGVLYHVVAMGHLHHFSVKERGYNQYEAYFGSPMGQNNYSKKGKFGSGSSQGLIIVNEHGELDFRRIDLQQY